MRSTSWARWATCALAITVCVPIAFAGGSRKSVSDCTAFDQTDLDDHLELKITNSCSIPVDCTISWQVVCAPASKSRRSVHPGQARFTLRDTSSQSANASAAVCKDDSFEINSISWTCQPNND